MLNSFSFFERQKIIANSNENQVYDLVIIGGGINGAGVARDAAMRGLKVLVLEKSDFASGTSSKSTKLIHGGLRYLENMEFKLVFEALNERSKLFEMAPHLVHPMRFLIPLYKQGRVKPFLMGLGMWIYDALSLFQAPELNEYLSVAKTQAEYPAVQTDNLLGSFRYSDAYMDDDRLTVETLRSAYGEGASVLSYCEVKTVNKKNNGHFLIDFEDKLSGNLKKVSAKHIVSCLGAWTDIFWEDMAKKAKAQFLPNWKNILRPTKGIHLTLNQERFPLKSAVVMAAEKRIVFAVPRHDMVIVGTTDTDFKENPSLVKIETTDVEYILEILQEYFPDAKIQKADFVAGYAGVRPLVADGAESEGKTSREHVIFSLDGVTFVAGGKYTTYRLMAKQIVDECLRFFPLELKANLRQAKTEGPLNPLIDFESVNRNHNWIQSLKKRTTLSMRDIEFLVSRHGQEVVYFDIQSKEESVWQIEARHAIRSTMCFNLIDFMVRRTPLFLSYADHGIFHLPQILQVFRQELKWTSKDEETQRNQYMRFIQNELHWK